MDRILLTADYVHAALVAILPYISDFCQKLELPVPLPVTTNMVQRFHPDDYAGDVGGYVVLTNRYEFWFLQGHVQAFGAPRAYYTLQRPEQIPEYYGNPKMNTQEAIAFARSVFRKLGYSDEQLYTDLRPEVKKPPKVRGHLIPHYRLTWYIPNFENTTSVRIDIDAEVKCVERLSFYNRNIHRPPPKLSVTPTILRRGRPPPPPIAPETARAFVIGILPELSEYARKLELPVPLPLTTNHVVRYVCTNRYGFLSASVELTNGYSLSHGRGYVTGFAAPDLFLGVPGVKLAGFTGRAKMTEAEALSLVRRKIKALGYDEGTLRIKGKPEVLRPNVRGHVTVPRVDFTWTETWGGGLLSRLYTEVDLQNGVLKSLYINNGRLTPKGAKPISQPDGTPFPK